jgi:hypothetical protein
VPNRDDGSRHVAARPDGPAAVQPTALRALVIGGLGYMFDGADNALVAFLLPSMAREWGLDNGALGLLASAGPVGYLVGALLAGTLGDRVGRRPIMMWALGAARCSSRRGTRWRTPAATTPARTSPSEGGAADQPPFPLGTGYASSHRRRLADLVRQRLRVLRLLHLDPDAAHPAGDHGDEELRLLPRDLAQIPGYFTGAWLSDRLDRKRTIAACLLGGAAAAFWLSQSSTPPAIMASGALLSFFLNGSIAATDAYTPELFPTWTRTTATGLASAFGPARLGQRRRSSGSRRPRSGSAACSR